MRNGGWEWKELFGKSKSMLGFLERVKRKVREQEMQLMPLIDYMGLRYPHLEGTHAIPEGVAQDHH